MIFHAFAAPQMVVRERHFHVLSNAFMHVVT